MLYLLFTAIFSKYLSRTRGARLKGRYYVEVVYMDFDSGH